MVAPEGVRWREDRGRFQWRVRYKDALGVWHEKTGFAETVSAAKRARRAALDRVDLSGGMTLAAWHEQYWPLIEGRLASGTLRAYDVAWRRRVAPSLGHLRLVDVTAFAIESAMTRWAGSGSTKRDALAVLANLLRGAHKAGLIEHVATSSVVPPRDHPRDPVSRALTVTELELLLAAVPDGAYRRFMAALAFTGCRLGEVAGLRVDDADLERNVLHVRRQVSPGRSGGMEARVPKSGKHRDVPIIEALRPYVLEAMEGRSRLDLLFPGPRGGRISSTNLSRALRWDELRSSIRQFGEGEAAFRFHDLRHTFATLAFDAGASAVDVQAVLGHASLQVTQRYAHARADAATRSAAGLNRLLRGPRVAPGSQSSVDEGERGVKGPPDERSWWWLRPASIR